MATAKSVLFVSHDATRAGATILLIDFLRWLKQHTDIPFQVLICSGGEMEPEFATLAKVWRLDPYAGRKAALRAATRRLMGDAEAANMVRFADLAPRMAAAASFGLIYSNTVANGRTLEALSPLQCPVLTHVHELEYSIRRYGGKDFEFVKRYTQRYVAVADGVRRNLMVRHGIAENLIERVYEFVPTMARPTADPSILKLAVAMEVGIPRDARIVGGCGTVDWRKGCDLFVQLAASVAARGGHHPPVHFLWLGAKPPADRFYELQHDLEHAGLIDRVHFIGSRPNPLDYIATFDLFALVSREDPFPLVVLEAAALGVPTVCFRDAGGSPEFVEDDAGCIVPYLDVTAMAHRVLELLHDDGRRATLGRRAQEKVRERHDIDVAAPALAQIVQRMLAGNAATAHSTTASDSR